MDIYAVPRQQMLWKEVSYLLPWVPHLTTSEPTLGSGSLSISLGDFRKGTFRGLQCSPRQQHH